MIWKFEPSDFTKGSCNHTKEMTERANAKLQEWLKYAKVVYNYKNSLEYGWSDVNCCSTLKALLINIEPIESCRHEANKVGMIPHIEMGNSKPYYNCSCGARVTPSGFEELK